MKAAQPAPKKEEPKKEDGKKTEEPKKKEEPKKEDPKKEETPKKKEETKTEAGESRKQEQPKKEEPPRTEVPKKPQESKKEEAPPKKVEVKEENLEDLIKGFKERMFWVEAEDHTTLAKITSTHQALFQSWLEFKTTEEKRVQASEKEDYELADQLTSGLEEIQAQLKAHEQHVTSLFFLSNSTHSQPLSPKQLEEQTASLKEVGRKKSDLFQSEAALREKRVSALTATKTAEEKEFKQKEESASSEQKKELMRFQLEKDNIERERRFGLLFCLVLM